MNGKQLKNSILQWAIQGKLVPQDPNDEPASILLERIRAEKAKLVKEKKIKKDKNESIIYRGDDNSYYEKFLATGEVQCIDDEIPFEIPQGWEWCRLGNIGITETGTTPSKTHPEYFGNYIPFLGPANILEDKIISETQGLSEEGVKHGRVVSSNSVIQVCIGGSIGKCAIVRKNVTFNQQINSITPIKCCLEYVHFVLQSETFRLAIMSKATGTATPIINRGNWEQLLFPLPPFDEQNKIVAKLGELLPLVKKYSEVQDCLVELNISINDKLKKSILQEAIQGKLVPQIEEEGTAQELLEQIQQEKQKLANDGKLKKSALTDSVIYKGDDNKYYEQVSNENTDITEEIPFDLPNNWTWIRFGQYVRMSIGKTPPRGETKYWTNGIYPWVSISDMSDYGLVKTTKETVSEYAQSLFGDISPAGTLIMSFKLTVGRTSILDISAYHNEAVISIYPFVDKDYRTRNYLFYILPIISNLGDSKDAIKGKTLNSKSLNNLLLPLPPLNEQGRIVAIIEQLFDKLR